MASGDKAIRIAAVRARGRIGAKAFAPPAAIADMTAWDRVELMDSALRSADAQARAGQAAEALRIYKQALAQPEEHWQCAGVIGIAKLGTPEAVTMLHAALKHPNARVRTTAAQAWKGLATA